MKNITFSFLLFFSLFFGSGCVGYTIKTASHPMSKYGLKNTNPNKDWKSLNIYSAIDEEEQYLSLARITVTGTEYTDTEERLLNKLRKEASRYRADAILHVETREVERTSFDGISATLNIATIFMADVDDTYLDMGGDYYTLEIEAIAIKFVEED